MSDTPPSAFGELGQISFAVTDLARAVIFLRDKVGLPFLFQAGPDLAFFRDPDGSLLGLMCEKR